MADIYQRIWDADISTNGLPAIRRGTPRPESGGYVEVDERSVNVSEDHRVISAVEIPESKKETYDLCRRLFDNYYLDPGIRELITDGEGQEESEFIEAITPLPPLQIAKEYIADRLNRSVSTAEFTEMIRQTWFLQGRAGSKHASGFEHVFVGEQSPIGNRPDDAVNTHMGGYHFWYKYYLDEAGDRLVGSGDDEDRIFYLGTRYGGAEVPGHGILVPEVITLEFRWKAPDFQLGGDQLLRKHPIGGFWVGPSPEGLIALGLVRARGGPTDAEINGSIYGVDFHPLDEDRSSIRTFFPRFRRCTFCAAVPPPDREEPVTGGVPTEDQRRARIIAALVNPPGNEAGRETVTLLNTSADRINLLGWSLIAPNGWTFTFDEVRLEAGESRAFRMLSESPQFRNRAGAITLRDPEGAVHDRVDYSTDDASQEGVTISFGNR